MVVNIYRCHLADVKLALYGTNHTSFCGTPAEIEIGAVPERLAEIVRVIASITMYFQYPDPLSEGFHL
jgi:hypothetical protein